MVYSCNVFFFILLNRREKEPFVNRALYRPSSGVQSLHYRAVWSSIQHLLLPCPVLAVRPGLLSSCFPSRDPAINKQHGRVLPPASSRYNGWVLARTGTLPSASSSPLCYSSALLIILRTQSVADMLPSAGCIPSERRWPVGSSASQVLWPGKCRSGPLRIAHSREAMGVGFLSLEQYHLRDLITDSPS